MRQFLSRVCLFSGFMLIFFSCYLFLADREMERTIKESTDKLLVDLFVIAGEEEIEDTGSLMEWRDPQSSNEAVVDGNQYSFLLNIPKLDLRLPVQTNWSYDKLTVSPCIYQEDPLWIAGHSYKAHFGMLYTLSVGDIVEIEDLSGHKEDYTVVSATKIKEDDTDKLSNPNYDLSLFTCTAENNEDRILIRLNKK